jgi:DNA-binding FrmR family transcriptional regulator
MIKDIKKRSLHRAKILEGQMRGIQSMIEREEYCTDIITQSLAIQKSLGSLNKLILENHIRTHIKDNIQSKSKSSQETAFTELVDLYDLNNNRS